MRYIVTLLTITSIIDSFGQELNGTINFAKDYSGYKMVEIIAKSLTRLDEKVYTKSDNSGHFNLKFYNGGHYQLSIKGPFEPDTTFNIDVPQHEILGLTISYPPKICPYELTKLTGICPDGSHTDNVVPIIYGLIIPDKELMIKVQKNEVELAGCMVTDCDPNWFCKTHDRRF